MNTAHTINTTNTRTVILFGSQKRGSVRGVRLRCWSWTLSRDCHEIEEGTLVFLAFNCRTGASFGSPCVLPLLPFRVYLPAMHVLSYILACLSSCLSIPFSSSLHVLFSVTFLRQSMYRRTVLTHRLG